MAKLRRKLCKDTHPMTQERSRSSDWIQGVLLGDKQGMNELTLVTIQSIGLIAFIIIGILLIGGNTNA